MYSKDFFNYSKFTNQCDIFINAKTVMGPGLHDLNFTFINVYAGLSVKGGTR